MKKLFTSLLTILCVCGVATAAQIGSYPVLLQSINIYGEKQGDPIATRLTVYTDDSQESSDSGQPCILSNDGNYFYGESLSFVYNESQKMQNAKITGTATFQQKVITVNGQSVLMAFFLFTGIPEIQDQLAIPFNATSGFEFINQRGVENVGIGFYTGTLNSKGEFEPAGLLSAYYLTPDPNGNSGNSGQDIDLSSMEGIWNFPLDDRYAEQESRLNEFTGEYQVSVTGNKVYFSFYAEGKHDNKNDMIGEAIDATTIRFSKAVTVSGIAYPIKQIPFVNTTVDPSKYESWELNDMYAALAATSKPIDAKYDPAAGTLTFPANSGMLWVSAPGDDYAPGGSSFNPKGYWIGANDFVGPAMRVSAVPASMSLVDFSSQVEGNSIVVSSGVQTVGFQPSDVATWKINVTETVGQGEDVDPIYQTTTAEVTLTNGRFTYTISNLTNGWHIYSVSLAAYDAQGELIATTGEKGIAWEIGPAISIRVPNAVAGDGNITVSCDVVTSGFDASAATYKMLFTDLLTVTDTNPGEQTYVNATLENGKATAILGGNPGTMAVGNYNYRVNLVAYQGTTEIAVSNNLEFTVTITNPSGIESIDYDNAEGVRYFNLQGVEVKNPAQGEILIRVANGKATKVVK